MHLYMVCTSAQLMQDTLGRGISREWISVHVFGSGSYLCNRVTLLLKKAKSLPQLSKVNLFSSLKVWLNFHFLVCGVFFLSCVQTQVTAATGSQLTIALMLCNMDSNLLSQTCGASMTDNTMWGNWAGPDQVQPKILSQTVIKSRYLRKRVRKSLKMLSLLSPVPSPSPHVQPFLALTLE